VADRRRYLGWVTAAALAGGLLYELSWTPAVPVPPTVGADAVLAEPAGLEAEASDLAALRATLERPLFNEDRRPDSLGEGAAGSAAASKLPAIRLSAVIVAADGGRTALVQPEGQERPVRVRKGDAAAVRAAGAEATGPPGGPAGRRRGGTAAGGQTSGYRAQPGAGQWRRQPGGPAGRRPRGEMNPSYNYF
jgi:hypothetical protein